jgi:hypothetical protein
MTALILAVDWAMKCRYPRLAGIWLEEEKKKRLK